MKFIGIKKNCFGAIIKPDLYIANRNYKKYSLMSSNTLIHLGVDFLFNDKSKITFTCYKYINDEYGNKVLNENFEYVKKDNTVLWDKVSWFIITEAKYNAKEESKEVTCYTCEHIFSKTYVRNVGNYNNIMDENVSETDVNLYALCDSEHKDKSCMHIAIANLPQWKIGYVDENINGVYNKHSFSIDSEFAYDFLKNEVSDSWDCLIMFDSLNMTINAYRYDNPLIMKETGIYLSLLNLIKEFELEPSGEKITKYLVSGGSDEFYGNSNVDISEVNMGSSIITDYTYVYDDFTDKLKSQFDLYKTTYDANLELFTQNYETLLALEEEYYVLYNKNTIEGSVIWSDYGLNALQKEYDKRNEIVASCLANNSETASEIKHATAIEMQAIQQELLIRQSQIDEKLNQISQLSNVQKTLYVSLEDFLTEDTKIELSNYNVEAEFTDDTFCTYSTQTGAEVLKVKKELLENAREKLKRDAQEKYELKIKLSSLFNMEEFNDYIDEIELGSVIRINYDKNLKDSGAVLDGRIIEISFNFDNLDDITVTLSNKKLLDSWCFEEIRKQASSSKNYIGSNNSSIKNTTSKTKQTTDFIYNNFCAMNNKMSTNKDDEVIISSGGIDIKKKLEGGLYSDRQLKIYSGGLGITRTGWRGEDGGLDVAIGDIILDDGTTDYGINARILMSDLIISHKMRIINEALSLRIDEDGFNLTNSINTIYMNPNDQQCFQILKNGTKVMYLDVNGNLNLTGTIRGSSIIGGDANFGNGTTIISSDGKITTNNIEATDGKFMGEIVAKSGQIAGFTIDEYELEAGEGDKYIRISPTRVGTGSGEWDYNYAGISLGHTPDGLNSKIFLRSDGYARFGLEVYGGSIKFNYDGYSFYTKNFKIMQDTGDLFLGGSVTSNSYLSFMTGSGGIEFQSGMNGNKYILFYGSSMQFNDNPIATQSYVDSAIESAISTLEAYIDSHSTD